MSITKKGGFKFTTNAIKSRKSRYLTRKRNTKSPKKRRKRRRYRRSGRKRTRKKHGTKKRGINKNRRKQ